MNSKLTSASLDYNNKKPLSSLDLLKQSLPSKSYDKLESHTVAGEEGHDVVQLSEAAKMMLRQSDSLAQPISANPDFVKSFAANPKIARPLQQNFFKLADALKKYKDVSGQLKPEKRPESGK